LIRGRDITTSFNQGNTNVPCGTRIILERLRAGNVPCGTRKFLERCRVVNVSCGTIKKAPEINPGLLPMFHVELRTSLPF
jgi:hypothetical protein